MSMDQVENIAEHIDPQSYKERLEKGVVKTSFLADSGNHHVDNGRRQGAPKQGLDGMIIWDVNMSRIYRTPGWCTMVLLVMGNELCNFVAARHHR